MAWWRWTWDVLFSLASALIALGLGMLMGNLIQGIPLDNHKEYTGDFIQLLNPYAFLIGLLTVAMFIMHGSIYIVMKTRRGAA